MTKCTWALVWASEPEALTFNLVPNETAFVTFWSSSSRLSTHFGYDDMHASLLDWESAARYKSGVNVGSYSMISICVGGWLVDNEVVPVASKY